jgi:large subunit ribosomal protein L25
MMSNVSQITVAPRDRSGKGAARATRRQGLVPGVVYGDKQSPSLIALDPRLIHSEMRKKGFHTRIFEIAIEGLSTLERAIVRDVQFHPVTDAALHIDFQRVGKDSLIHVAVPVSFLNETASPGLKKGGVLNIVRHEVEIYCRPDAMPQSLDVDLTGREIGDSIHFSAITLPEGARPVIADRDFTIATIAPPTVAPAAEG